VTKLRTSGPGKARIYGTAINLLGLVSAIESKTDAQANTMFVEWETDLASNISGAPASELTSVTKEFITLFCTEYLHWTEKHYGEKRPYVVTRADRLVLIRDIVPYLRERSGGKLGPALRVWAQILKNYFASTFSNERMQFHGLKEIINWIQPLELSPVGGT